MAAMTCRYTSVVDQDGQVVQLPNRRLDLSDPCLLGQVGGQDRTAHALLCFDRAGEFGESGSPPGDQQQVKAAPGQLACKFCADAC
jgi:hypothetical protein